MRENEITVIYMMYKCVGIGHKKRRPMIQSPFILMENPII